MSFWLLGAAVVLAVHAIATSLASLLVAHRHRGARQALAGLPPAERASRLLRAALFPVAAFAAGAAFLPAARPVPCVSGGSGSESVGSGARGAVIAM